MNIFLCDSLHIAKLLSQRAMPTLNCFSTLLRMTDFHGLSGLLTWVTVAWTHQLAHVARAAEERARTKRCSRAQGVPSTISHPVIVVVGTPFPELQPRLGGSTWLAWPQDEPSSVWLGSHPPPHSWGSPCQGLLPAAWKQTGKVSSLYLSLVSHHAFPNLISSSRISLRIVLWKHLKE